MEIQKSSSELWHSTVWLIKKNSSFPSSPLAQFKISANPSRGQNYLVSDSLLCNSVLVIMLATSNPCSRGSLNHIFCLSSPVRLLKFLMPSLLPSCDHKYLQISPGKSSSQNVSLPLCNSCLFGILTPQKLLVALAALSCRTGTRVRQVRHVGHKIQGSTPRVLWVLY